MPDPEALFNILGPVLLCLPRIAGALLLAPFLNVLVIGGMSTRNAIILIMGLFVYPLVSAQVSAGVSLSYLLVLAVKELVLGLMLGIIPLAIFWCFQSVQPAIMLVAGLSDHHYPVPHRVLHGPDRQVRTATGRILPVHADKKRGRRSLPAALQAYVDRVF